MDYYKVIEFLVQDVAKKDELIAMLEAKLNSHDVKVLNDELKNMTIEKDHWKAEALEYRNEKEPEWWAEEKKYKAEIEGLKSSKDNSMVRIATYMSSTEQEVSDAVDEFNSLFDGEYFTYREWVDDAVYRIDGFISKNKLEDTDMLMDFEIIEELDADVELYKYKEEIGAHMRKINTLCSELESANNRYRNLLDSVKGSDKAYQDKIEALQLEINHLKNNK